MSTKPTFPHVVIRASAGTGKTYQLAVRFIGLLASGARPDEILATTFTRKAAGEILDRVLHRLAKAAADESERTDLAAKIGKQSLSADECRELLIATIGRLHTLRIGTLDSYFLQIATSFGPELGLPPGWSICDELIDALLRDEAIELVLARGRLADLSTLVHSLTKGAAQRSVARLVRDTVGSLFELYRETQPTAWQQIPVCKGLAAEELEQTLESIAAHELSTAQLKKTRDKDLEKARLGDWDGLIDSGIAAKIVADDYTFNKKPLPPELVAFYQRLLKHVESILVGQVARQTEATHQLLERYAEHYHALQLDEGALRFSDVTFRLAEAAALLGAEGLAFRLDGGVRHLLLDEFQDTSPAQWRVLLPLAQRVMSAGGTFFCVGDAKQAIYGWRGGVAEIFDALDGQLGGLTWDNLAASYRSSQPVIDAVNAVFRNLANHSNLDKLAAPVGQWQAVFPQHTTEKRELRGHVTLMTAPQATDDEQQADVLIEYAARCVRDAALAAPQTSIGVLVRTNSAVARLIYALRRLNIFASEEGGNPLVDSPAVELILSLLKLADHPADSVARFHLANSPLAESLALGDFRNHAAAGRLSRQLRRQLLDAGYGAAVFDLAKRLAPSCDLRDLSRLQQLVELAYEYQPASTLRTSDFLKLVETRRIVDPQSSKVRVMTIHQAKGLEFDVVFLPELDARLVGQPDPFVAGRPGATEPVNIVCRLASERVREFFPEKLRKLFEDDMCRELHEALCVLYVAMTRPVHALHMIIAPAKANERNLPKTFAGLLRATLASGRPATGGVMLYEHGDANWHRTTQARRASEGSPPSTSTQTPAVIRLAPSAGPRQRGLERKGPSSLEGGERLSAASVLSANSGRGFAIGTLFHAWLAEIAWLNDGEPSDATLRQIAARLRSQIGDLSDQLDIHIGHFRQELAAKEIVRVLSRQFYDSPANLGLDKLKKSWPLGDMELIVHREHPFAIRSGDEILAGAIDRLVVIKHGGHAIAADVLDFKTDELPPGDKKALAAKILFYQPQIEAYRAAAAKLLSLDAASIAARLIFLATGAIHAI